MDAAVQALFKKYKESFELLSLFVLRAREIYSAVVRLVVDKIDEGRVPYSVLPCYWTFQARENDATDSVDL